MISTSSMNVIVALSFFLFLLRLRLRSLVFEDDTLVGETLLPVPRFLMDMSFSRLLNSSASHKTAPSLRFFEDTRDA